MEFSQKCFHDIIDSLFLPALVLSNDSSELLDGKRESKRFSFNHYPELPHHLPLCQTNVFCAACVCSNHKKQKGHICTQLELCMSEYPCRLLSCHTPTDTLKTFLSLQWTTLFPGISTEEKDKNMVQARGYTFCLFFINMVKKRETAFKNAQLRVFQCKN